MQDFSQTPFLVIWEVTQACDLACRHCRAEAEPRRHSLELSTEEGFALLKIIRDMGSPLMIFTGGDPLKRPDIFELLRYSHSLGLRTTVTPSATPLLTHEAVCAFRRCGVTRMALSVDGPDAETHDAFRGVPGSFLLTLRGLEAANRIGLETQINTTVTRWNFHRLDEIAQMVERSGAKLWSVFFLVATGRAAVEDDLSAEEYEEVFAFLHELNKRAPFDIKTTEAPHFRRYTAQQKKAGNGLPKEQTSARAAGLRQAGIRDGNGMLFISHIGEVFPSGFLPVSAGNVRFVSLDSVYRHSDMFKILRDSDALGGKCGACEYRKLCGGSRARAFAMDGDWMAEDPRCVYQPQEVMAV